MVVTVLGIQEKFYEVVRGLTQKEIFSGSEEIVFVESKEDLLDGRSTIDIVVQDFLDINQERLSDAIKATLKQYNVLGSKIVVHFAKQRQTVADILGEVQYKLCFLKNSKPSIQ